MNSSALRSVAIVWLSLLILAVPLTVAEEPTDSFLVYTDKEEYLVGEVVNIYVEANTTISSETVNITDVVVYDPGDIAVAEWHGLSIILTATSTPANVGSMIAESEGIYSVLANAGHFFDVNGNGEHDSEDVSIVESAYGSYPGHPDWNPLADLNQDNFVDVRDLLLVIKNCRLDATWSFSSEFSSPNSVPDIPLGPIVAVIAFLVAIGFYGIRNKNSMKTRKNW